MASANPDSGNTTTASDLRKWLQEGIALQRQNNHEEAEIYYQRILQNSPQHSDALQLMGTIRFKQGKLDEAVQLTKTSLQLTPKDQNVLLNLARMYFAMNQFDDALRSYQAVTNYYPDSFDGWHGIGRCHAARGLFAESLQAYEKVLQINPKHPGTLLNMGGLYFTANRFSEAEKMYRRLLDFMPNHVNALNGLGASLQQQGNLGEAVNLFMKAVRINPSMAESYVNLGFVQHELRDYESSISTSRKAIQMSPDSAIANNNLSIALHAMGFIEECEASARRAVEINPNYSTAYNSLGNALHSQGKNEEAQQAYLQAIALNKHYASAYRNLAQVKKFKAGEDDALISTMLTFYETGDVNARKNLAFALAKAYENIKEPEKAFKCYLEGNRLRRKDFGFNPAEVETLFNDIKKQYSAEYVASAPTSNIDDKTPIFILGMPRSGTTLVEQILASHPDVFGAEELRYMAAIALRGTKQWFGQSYPYFLNDPEPKPKLEQIGQFYLEKLRNHSGDSPRATDKMPANYQYIGLILQALPNAKIIHCKRGAMDNCFSIFKYYFAGSIDYAYDMQDLGDYYLLYEDLMNHWKSVYGDRIFEVEYERMTEESETMIPELLKFCDLSWHDDCLNFHATERTVRTASASQVRQPIYKSSVEAWRKYETQLEPLKKALKIS